MIDSRQIVDEARAWIGTPFHHQGRMRGVGVDCAGLIIGVARAVQVPVQDVLGYARSPRLGLLEAELMAQLDAVPENEVRAGDVLLLRILQQPQHLAIVTETDPLTMVHAYGGSGVHKCVEHVVDARWRKRIIGAYRFRGQQ